MKESSIHILRGEEWGGRLQRALAGSELSEVDWMRQHTKLLKSDSHSRVGLLQLHGGSCYLKFYQAKSPGQKMLFRLGYARALHSFDAAMKLLAVNIQVPTPLSALLLPRGMMLLTEGIVDGKDLKAIWGDNIEESQRELLMAGAGYSLAKLHRAGYCHGDCKWSNFLWSADEFYLVDLEGVKKIARGSPRQARDLARFTMNAEDMGVLPEHFEWFLDSYLVAGNYPRETTIRAILPFLQQLRKRHKLKYGQRGHQILGGTVK